MAKYKLTNEAKNDLIRIHHYGVKKFGMTQADKYFESLFEYFDIIAERPFSFESVDYIKKGYRRCVCGVDSIYYKFNENIVEIVKTCATGQPMLVIFDDLIGSSSLKSIANIFTVDARHMNMSRVFPS